MINSGQPRDLLSKQSLTGVYRYASFSENALLNLVPVKEKYINMAAKKTLYTIYLQLYYIHVYSYIYIYIHNYIHNCALQQVKTEIHPLTYYYFLYSSVLSAK